MVKRCQHSGVEKHVLINQLCNCSLTANLLFHIPPSPIWLLRDYNYFSVKLLMFKFLLCLLKRKKVTYLSDSKVLPQR